jgi:CRISPR-associated protein (TIGR02710 family)
VNANGRERTSQGLQLSAADLEKWRELAARDREAALAFYFEALLPPILEHLQSLGCHSALRTTRYDTLVSLMGFSPETTVITTALLRPQNVVALRSQGTTESLDLAAEFLISKKFLRHSAFNHVEVDPTDPVQIYDKIAQHLPKGSGHNNIIDVTGGKKVMSATAAIAASELDIPLCYVEGEYDAQMRRPAPGSERLILLPNPSRLSARQRRERALDRYEAYDYPAALAAWQESREAQPHSSHLDEFAVCLCQAYVAWVDLDRKSLTQRLHELSAMLARPNLRPLRRGTERMDAHLDALHLVARGEDVAMLASFFELAHRYADRGRHDMACLLAYRSIEAVVQLGLRRVTNGKFDCHDPDYGLLGDVAAVEQKFVALGRSIGNTVERLPSRVAMLDGLLLLGVVDEAVLTRLAPGKRLASIAGWVKNAAETRNSSVLAHGVNNLGPTEFRSLMDLAQRLAKAILAADNASLLGVRELLSPLRLREAIAASS